MEETVGQLLSRQGEHIFQGPHQMWLRWLYIHKGTTHKVSRSFWQIDFIPLFQPISALERTMEGQCLLSCRRKVFCYILSSGHWLYCSSSCFGYIDIFITKRDLHFVFSHSNKNLLRKDLPFYLWSQRYFSWQLSLWQGQGGNQISSTLAVSHCI